MSSSIKFQHSQEEGLAFLKSEFGVDGQQAADLMAQILLSTTRDEVVKQCKMAGMDEAQRDKFVAWMVEPEVQLSPEEEARLRSERASAAAEAALRSVNTGETDAAMAESFRPRWRKPLLVVVVLGLSVAIISWLHSMNGQQEATDADAATAPEVVTVGITPAEITSAMVAPEPVTPDTVAEPDHALVTAQSALDASDALQVVVHKQGERIDLHGEKIEVLEERVSTMPTTVSATPLASPPRTTACAQGYDACVASAVQRLQSRGYEQMGLSLQEMQDIASRNCCEVQRCVRPMARLEP